MDSNKKFSKMTDVIRQTLLSHGVDCDAEANTLSIYYYLPPDGFFQNRLRIANHASSVKQMFGRTHKFFPGIDEYGNVTLYIQIERKTAYKSDIPDYMHPKNKSGQINKKAFDKLKDLYSKNSNGYPCFPYKIYLFDGNKFYNNEALVHQDALTEIGDSSYDWLQNKGKNAFVVPASAQFAFIKKVDCIGYIMPPLGINEFKSYVSNELDFKVGSLVIEETSEKYDVMLRVKDLPGRLLKDFIEQYGYPVNNSLRMRKMVNVNTNSGVAAEMLRDALVTNGIDDGDIAIREDEDGIIVDIKDSKSKMIFAMTFSEMYNMSYADVCKKFNI